jgi:hypothetical protein
LRINEYAKQETSKQQAVSRNLKMEAYVLSKLKVAFIGLHCILVQKVHSSLTAMRISNPTITFQIIYLQKL